MPMMSVVALFALTQFDLDCHDGEAVLILHSDPQYLFALYINQ